MVKYKTACLLFKDSSKDAPVLCCFCRSSSSFFPFSFRRDFEEVLFSERCEKRGARKRSCAQATLVQVGFVSLTTRDDGSRQHLTTDSARAEQHQGSGAAGAAGGVRAVRQAVKDHSSEIREARKQVRTASATHGL